MKKSNLTKLLILSLSALTCFAACKQPSSSSASFSPSTSETPETPSVPSVTIPENAHVVSKTAAANAAAKGWTNSALYSTFEISEVAKASVSVTTPSSYGQNSGKYYTKGTNWRIYQSETPTLKIELTEGNELVAVAISYVSENTGAITYDGKVVESGVLVAATGSSISFGVGNTGTATNGQARITEIKVAYLGQAPTEQEPVTPPSSETSQPSSSEKSEPSSSQSSSAEKLEPEFLEGATVYTFANYTAGTQYAANEEHVLDENVKVHTTESHFTAELRLYSSESHNGYAIFSSTKAFTGIGVNAGNNADELNVYGSNDGTEYTLIGSITTAKAYNDYKLEFGSASYSYIKLDVAGSKQVRLKSVSFTFAE